MLKVCVWRFSVSFCVCMRMGDVGEDDKGLLDAIVEKFQANIELAERK